MSLVVESVREQVKCPSRPSVGRLCRCVCAPLDSDLATDWRSSATDTRVPLIHECRAPAFAVSAFIRPYVDTERAQEIG